MKGDSLNDIITRDLVAAYDKVWRPVEDAMLLGGSLSSGPTGIRNVHRDEVPLTVTTVAHVMEVHRDVLTPRPLTPEERAAWTQAEADDALATRLRVARLADIAAAFPIVAPIIARHQPDEDRDCAACSDIDGWGSRMPWPCPDMQGLLDTQGART